MKKIFLLGSLVAMATASLSAQTEAKTKAIQLSVGAETRGFSLSYEQKLFGIGRLNHFSLRGALGYGFTDGKWFLSTYNHNGDKQGDRRWYSPKTEKLEQYSLGGELNYRFGKRKHFVEVAQGISLDYFSSAVNFYAHKDKLGERPSLEEVNSLEPSKFASHLSTRVGYRFVANNGFTLGVGASMHWYQGPFTYFYALKHQAMPYLSIGYSF